MRAEDILPDQVNGVVLDGLPVRKGSVAAFLANARLLADPGTAEDARAQASSDLVDLVPAMVALKVFDVFSVRDPAVAALVARTLA